MTSRPDPRAPADHAPLPRRAFEAFRWAILVLTFVAALIGVALLAGTVLHAMLPA